MTKEALERNIHRIDDYMACPRHSIISDAELNPDIFLYFLSYYITFYLLKEPFTCVLPFDQYWQLLQFAKDNPKVTGKFDFAGPNPGFVLKQKIMSGESGKAVIQNQFSISSFVARYDGDGGHHVKNGTAFTYHGQETIYFKLEW